MLQYQSYQYSSLTPQLRLPTTHSQHVYAESVTSECRFKPLFSAFKETAIIDVFISPAVRFGSPSTVSTSIGTGPGGARLGSLSGEWHSEEERERLRERPGAGLEPPEEAERVRRRRRAACSGEASSMSEEEEYLRLWRRSGKKRTTPFICCGPGTCGRSLVVGHLRQPRTFRVRFPDMTLFLRAALLQLLF